MTKAQPHLEVIATHVTDRIKTGQSLDQFLDEFLKDKSPQNFRRVKTLNESLKILDGLVIISDEWQNMKKRLEESEVLAPSKNLETFIKEILTKKPNKDVQKVIDM